MSKRQLALLCVVNLVSLLIGRGLVPLLPVYAMQLGADRATAGYLMSLIYAGVAAGALSAAWVSERLGSHKVPIMGTALLSMPILWLAGRVTVPWQLAALTGLSFYMGGLNLATVAILAGLFAQAHERGRVFGTLALTAGIGAVIGGLAIGFMVDHWGYRTMFAVLISVLPLRVAAGLLLDDKLSVSAQRTQAVSRQPVGGLGSSFRLLLISSILISIMSYIGALSSSLLMNSRGLGAAAITSLATVGGVGSILFPYWTGRLSDRLGHKAMVLISFWLSVVRLPLLLTASALWHFWGLTAFEQAVTTPAGPALAADLVPQESLGRAMSLQQSTGYLGGVIGSALAGYLIQHLGFLATLLGGAGLAIVAAALIIPIHPPERATV